jgi:hypothetical protein
MGASAQVARLATWPRAHINKGAAYRGAVPELCQQNFMEVGFSTGFGF